MDPHRVHGIQELGESAGQFVLFPTSNLEEQAFRLSVGSCRTSSGLYVYLLKLFNV